MILIIQWNTKALQIRQNNRVIQNFLGHGKPMFMLEGEIVFYSPSLQKKLVKAEDPLTFQENQLLKL